MKEGTERKIQIRNVFFVAKLQFAYHVCLQFCFVITSNRYLQSGQLKLEYWALLTMHFGHRHKIKLGFSAFHIRTGLCPFDIFVTDLTVFIATICSRGLWLINKNICIKNAARFLILLSLVKENRRTSDIIVNLFCFLETISLL